MLKTTNITKILVVMFLVVMATMSIQPLVYAQEDQTKMIEPNSIKPTYDNQATNDLKGIAGKVIGLIRNIAVIAGVILLTVLGVKYMMGSVEEKAEYKKSLMPLVIGIIVVMAATQIATMIFGFFD